MKTRIVTGAMMVAILSLSVFGLPNIFTALLVAAMAAVAAYELLIPTGLVVHKRLVAYSAIAAFATVMWCYAGSIYVWGLLGVIIFTLAVFGEMMANHSQLHFTKVTCCYMAGVLVPYLLASLVRIEGSLHGPDVIIIPFIVAFVSDSGAYFAGRFFGKHKLAPILSPKKTIEGMIGGVICAIAFMLLYAWFMRFVFSMQTNYLYAIIYGVVGSLGAVVGDLMFSAIKRQTGIKDYGNLFPGHGGILDRFDSMIIVGPMMEALLVLLPILE